MNNKTNEPVIYTAYYTTKSMVGVSIPFLTRNKSELKRYLENLHMHAYKPTVYIRIYTDELLLIGEETLTEYKGEEIEWLN